MFDQNVFLVIYYKSSRRFISEKKNWKIKFYLNPLIGDNLYIYTSFIIFYSFNLFYINTNVNTYDNKM